MDPSIAAIIIGGLAAFLFLARQYTLSRRDPKEPPFIAPKIPLIGHVISQFIEGPKFLHRLKYAFPNTRNPSILTSHDQ